MNFTESVVKIRTQPLVPDKSSQLKGCKNEGTEKLKSLCHYGFSYHKMLKSNSSSLAVYLIVCHVNPPLLYLTFPWDFPRIILLFVVVFVVPASSRIQSMGGKRPSHISCIPRMLLCLFFCIRISFIFFYSPPARLGLFFYSVVDNYSNSDKYK